jgi:hypothetical protein
MAISIIHCKWVLYSFFLLDIAATLELPYQVMFDVLLLNISRIEEYNTKFCVKLYCSFFKRVVQYSVV